MTRDRVLGAFDYRLEEGPLLDQPTLQGGVVEKLDHSRDHNRLIVGWSFEADLDLRIFPDLLADLLLLAGVEVKAGVVGKPHQKGPDMGPVPSAVAT